MFEKRVYAPSDANVLIPSTFAVASAGAVENARWRIFASTVLDTVIAAVPAAPATRPLPIDWATFVTVMSAPPWARARGGPRRPWRRGGRAGGRRRAARSPSL